MDHMNHMDHSSNGELPRGITVATTPKFKVGSEAIINTDHMEGMDKAVATIVGAFNTTAFTITYTPTTGGEKVKNHKWIVHEEIRGASNKSYYQGDRVIVEAEHMDGMKGAEAMIDSADQTTVYMIDFISTIDGELVKNHKWVTEMELSSN